MRVQTALAWLLAATVVAGAAPAPPEVKFPAGPIVPTPMPPPAAAVATITTDRLFVIESKEPVTITSSPQGLVKVTAEKAPFNIKAKFSDGTGEYERRTYQGPHVYVIDPVKSGECELLILPEKVTSEADILRHKVRVDDGTAPQPPPKPVDPPTPTDPSPFPGDGLRVMIVYEKDELAKLSQSQLNVLTSADVRTYLNAKCAGGSDGWVVTDKDVSFSAKVWADAIKRERKAVPWIVVGNGKTGFEGPLPASVTDTLALLKKYGG